MANQISGDTYRIIAALIQADLLPGYIKTSKAVELINDKRFHRAKLYKDHYKQMLGARRLGAGRNYEFDLVKVLYFRARLEP